MQKLRRQRAIFLSTPSAKRFRRSLSAGLEDPHPGPTRRTHVVPPVTSCHERVFCPLEPLWFPRREGGVKVCPSSDDTLVGSKNMTAGSSMLDVSALSRPSRYLATFLVSICIVASEALSDSCDCGVGCVQIVEGTECRRRAPTKVCEENLAYCIHHCRGGPQQYEIVGCNPGATCMTPWPPDAYECGPPPDMHGYNTFHPTDLYDLVGTFGSYEECVEGIKTITCTSHEGELCGPRAPEDPVSCSAYPCHTFEEDQEAYDAACRH